jgi:dTDP-4-amino-4,6-dideoxygalactose transaminase
VPVHVYGQMADLDAIVPIARQHGLKLLEDCAQSTGARQHGRVCGSIGDAGAFSFYPTKNLGAIGDGGMIVTGDTALADRLTRLRQYGWDNSRISAEIGVNSRLDEMQAAILAVKLAHLGDDNGRRQAIARRYTEALAGLPLTLPAVRPGNEPVWHLYVVATDRRDALLAHLKADGVLAGIHYAQAAHQQPGYRPHVRLAPGGLPVTERIVDRVLSLPLYPELEAEAVEHVIASVRRFYG